MYIEKLIDEAVISVVALTGFCKEDKKTTKERINVSTKKRVVILGEK